MLATDAPACREEVEVDPIKCAVGCQWPCVYMFVDGVSLCMGQGYYIKGCGHTTYLTIKVKQIQKTSNDGESCDRMQPFKQAELITEVRSTLHGGVTARAGLERPGGGRVARMRGTDEGQWTTWPAVAVAVRQREMPE